MNNKFLAVLVIFIGSFVGNSYAQSAMNPEIEGLVNTFADKVIENRIYLKPGCIYISSNEIFINIDNDLVSVDRLSVDNDGIYLEAAQLSNTIRCGDCKKFYDPDKQYSGCPHDPKNLKDPKKPKRKK